MNEQTYRQLDWSRDRQRLLWSCHFAFTPDDNDECSLLWPAVSLEVLPGKSLAHACHLCQQICNPPEPSMASQTPPAAFQHTICSASRLMQVILSPPPGRTSNPSHPWLYAGTSGFCFYECGKWGSSLRVHCSRMTFWTREAEMIR